MNIMLMLNCLNFLSLVKNCNHKRLGLYYILSALIFGISGTLLSLIIRVELYSSGNRIIPPENQNIYNVTITLHGLIMIFFLVMPSLFGHPEVYILILPAFGLISQIISSTSQKVIFGNQSMIFAMSSISLLGSVVWGHHMFTVGMEVDTRAYFSGVTIMISLPTGTKIFNWLSTYLSSHPQLSLSSSNNLYALMFLLQFTIGGATGVILGNASVDLALHDTYYVVAHFHYVLSLGAVIAIFASTIHFLPKMTSSFLIPSPTSQLSLYNLVLVTTGITLTFLPMHFLGFNVMPRRIPDYPDSFHGWNFLASVGSGITLLSFAILHH